jgi:hypothetical protein
MKLAIRAAVRGLAALAAALVAARGLAAQAAVPVTDARILAIRDDATRNRVRDYVEAARLRGTPTEPLVSRALEGVAFKADAKKIEAAMAALEKRMRRAKELLAPHATPDEVSAAADAIANDVPESAIRDLRRVAPQRTITVEIGVLTELIVKRVSPRQAAQMVRDLMARGATAAQLTELNAAVQQDVALGVTPVEALRVRGRGVMSLIAPPLSATAAQPQRP